MEGIRGFEHPLQTPIILDCIFENLDIYDLQECRQVCKTWRRESGKAMRAVATVKIECNKEGKRASEFLELVETNESIFFEAPFAEEFTLMNGPDCPNFWETCGAYVKTLQLEHVIFSSADSFRHAIFQCCPNLQKLELFDVQVCGEPAPEPQGWVPPQFPPNRNLKTLSVCRDDSEFSIGSLEILSQFPCIEKLIVRDMERPFESEAIFRALEVARQHDPSNWNIKEVELEGFTPPSLIVPASFIRVFGNGDLALTSFSITLYNGSGRPGITEENVRAVRNILVAHAHTLKKISLALSFWLVFQETDIFPLLPGNQVLENLQALKLIGVRISSIRFLEAFPNLKKIMLEVDKIPEDTQTTLEQCTELILDNQIRSIEDFKRLLGFLPNLKKLRIGPKLDKEWFPLICENWPELTHLELSELDRLDDASISGYDLEDVMKINENGPSKSWRPVTVRRVNLSSLKSLKSLSWSLSPAAYSYMGWCTQACGISELPNLKHLRLERMILTDRDRYLWVEQDHHVVESLLEQFPWDDSQEIASDYGP